MTEQKRNEIPSHFIKQDEILKTNQYKVSIINIEGKI